MSAVIEPCIDELIERSSLGTPAARALRARTTDEEVAVVDRLLNILGATRDSARDPDSGTHIGKVEELELDRSDR